MKLKLLFTFLIVLSSFIISAQQVVISGTITDEKDGSQLPGVNVVIKGTTKGVITSVEGFYTISAPPGSTLVFSFVGYSNQEIIVGNANATNNIALSQAVTGLDEIVIIGYGTVKKKDATGSVAVVSSKDFNKGAITSPQDLIVGKTAGVVITTNSGAPGSGATIRIRGGSSLNASNDPLIVVDGVPLDNTNISGLSNGLSTINPNDIETFTVLKDASATAIYGSRASNGVILITTKKGKEGQNFKVSYNGNASMSYLPKFVDVLNGDEYRKLIANLIATNASGFSPGVDTLLGKSNTNWQKEIYQTAISHDHNLSFSGSKYSIPYRISGGYTNQDGVLKNSNMDRKTVSVAVNPSFLKDHLKVDMNWKYMHSNNNFSNTDAIGSSVRFDPTQPVRNNSKWGGYYTWLINQNDPYSSPNVLATGNPLAQINQTDNTSVVKRQLGNAQFDYKFHFLPDLRANLNVGYDYSSSLGHDNRDTTAAFQGGGNGQEKIYTQTLKNKLLDFYLNYLKDINEIDSRIDITGGYSWQYFYRTDQTIKQNIRPPVLSDTSSNGTSENFLISFFGRMNYTLKNKYLLTFTLRDDGSSRFSKNTRWGLFPSAALGWKIIEEPFLKNVNSISDLKLRLGWGVTGQQNISNSNYSIDYYPYLATYLGSTSTAQYPFGGQFYTTQRPNPYDVNIKWEETTTQNVGLDFGFFKNRITGSLDYYIRKTNNLIGLIPVPLGTNFTNLLTTNVGNMENKGYELTLDTKIISSKDWFWEVGYNLSYNKNEITKLLKISDPNYVGVPVGFIGGGVGNTVQIYSVGYPKSSFFVYQQVYGQNGMPIEGLYVDRSGNGGNVISNLLNKYHYQKSDPDYTMGISSKLSYKKIDFSFSGRINLGNYVYNNLASNATYSGILSSTHYFSNVPRSINDTKFTNAQYFSDFYVENASFFKMDNISLGYNFAPFMQNKISMRLGLTVQNVFVITKYTGLDPEVNDGTNPGIDNNIYPRPRTYLVALSLDF